MITITVIVMMKVMIIKKIWRMNNKKNESATKVCDNKDYNNRNYEHINNDHKR